MAQLSTDKTQAKVDQQQDQQKEKFTDLAKNRGQEIRQAVVKGITDLLDFATGAAAIGISGLFTACKDGIAAVHKYFTETRHERRQEKFAGLGAEADQGTLKHLKALENDVMVASPDAKGDIVAGVNQIRRSMLKSVKAAQEAADTPALKADLEESHSKAREKLDVACGDACLTARVIGQSGLDEQTKNRLYNVAGTLLKTTAARIAAATEDPDPATLNKDFQAVVKEELRDLRDGLKALRKVALAADVAVEGAQLHRLPEELREKAQKKLGNLIDGLVTKVEGAASDGHISIFEKNKLVQAVQDMNADLKLALKPLAKEFQQAVKGAAATEKEEAEILAQGAALQAQSAKLQAALKAQGDALADRLDALKKRRGALLNSEAAAPEAEVKVA